MPGLVSTLLNQAYSTPGRLVQTFLQVTEQVWQPMHLSRFSTMPICARTFIPDLRLTSASHTGLPSSLAEREGGRAGEGGRVVPQPMPGRGSAPCRFARGLSCLFSRI